MTAAIVVVVAWAVVHYVVAALPGHFAVTLNSPTMYTLEKVLQAFLTLAFVVSPAIVLAIAWWWRRWRIGDVVTGVLVGCALSASFIGTLFGGAIPRTLVGNLLEPEGALGQLALAGNRPLLFASPAWEVLNLLALVAGIALAGVLGGIAGAAIRVPLRRDPIGWIGSMSGALLLFVLLYGAAITAYGLAVYTYDRYLWPVALPMVVLLLLRPTGFDPVRPSAEPTQHLAVPRARSPVVIAVMLTIILASTSVALLLNGNAFDAARWSMGEAAVRRGISAETIDAGYEWVGFHSTGLAVPFQQQASNETWYAALWPNFRLCAMVSSSPLSIEGFTLEHINLAAYRTMLFFGSDNPLYLYRVAGEGC